MRTFRIYGDNVVECERVAGMIMAGLNACRNFRLASPSVIAYDIAGCLTLELLPGFNKSGRSRWPGNVLEVLKRAGSILDETPDAIVTRLDEDIEEVCFAIEFCSALQAGNQAWQRSGRAFSTGRTGCPYIYIVDFVKYELNSETRERKALRFPNPLVPYSYITFSTDGRFTAQAYVKSEEFERTGKLADFPVDAFARDDLERFMTCFLLDHPARDVCRTLLAKNMAVVRFLAKEEDISIAKSSIPFRKSIARKSIHGMAAKMRDLGSRYGVGVARDFPFGVIPAAKREAFAKDLKTIYPDFRIEILEGSGDLVFCMIKGFKPRGDDNRPDRGILPLVMMLYPDGIDILTFIYGPILGNNLSLLENDQRKLCTTSGFWNAILSLSDFLLIDSPVIPSGSARLFLDGREFKRERLALPRRRDLTFPTFDPVPLLWQEDDVDTAIHYIFAHILGDICFEGLCNPPGGDWSGLSFMDGETERRWLSLPRVSQNCKRPDHVLQIVRMDGRSLLLVIESKELPFSLEPNVGPMLLDYIKNLARFVPNVENDGHGWRRCGTKVDFDGCGMLSAAAYLGGSSMRPEAALARTGCDLAFELWPSGRTWRLGVYARTGSRVGQLFVDWLKSELTLRNSGITLL